MQQNPGRVITKYQFSPLEAEAWLKAMSPSSIIRDTGIYPYNLDAVLHKVPSADPTTTDPTTTDPTTTDPTTTDPTTTDPTTTDPTTTDPTATGPA